MLVVECVFGFDGFFEFGRCGNFFEVGVGEGDFVFVC